MKPHRSKLSVTIDSRVEATLTRFARQEKIPKSRVVEDAIRLWEKHRLAQLAREGYRKMAAADDRDAEAYLGALEDLGE